MLPDVSTFIDFTPKKKNSLSKCTRCILEGKGCVLRPPIHTKGILVPIYAKAVKKNVVAVDAAKPFALWAFDAFEFLDGRDNLAHREEAFVRRKRAPRGATVPSRPN